MAEAPLLPEAALTFRLSGGAGAKPAPPIAGEVVPSYLAEVYVPNAFATRTGVGACRRCGGGGCVRGIRRPVLLGEEHGPEDRRARWEPRPREHRVPRRLARFSRRTRAPAPPSHKPRARRSVLREAPVV